MVLICVPLIVKNMEYTVVCWPDVQALMDRNGFRSNCRLINGIRGLRQYGSSAYLVPNEWLYRDESDDESDMDFNEYIDEVYDDELESLDLLF